MLSCHSTCRTEGSPHGWCRWELQPPAAADRPTQQPLTQCGVVGCSQHTVQVGRADWGRNAAALTDMGWWKGTLKPRPAVDWYLNRLNASLDELKREVDGAPITLLAHSAGGWLGRVFMKEFGVYGIDRWVGDRVFVYMGGGGASGRGGNAAVTRGCAAECRSPLPAAGPLPTHRAGPYNQPHLDPPTSTSRWVHHTTNTSLHYPPIYPV